MQSRQARSDPSRGTVIPNSSSALMLLWLFLHLHLLAFFSTSLQDNWWNSNGQCWLNKTQKDDSNHHVWNLPLVSMSASWFLVSMYLTWIFGSNLILSNNQSRATLWVLETCLIVGLLPFMIILITASLSSNTYNKASWREELTSEEIKSTLSGSSIIPWDFFRFWSLWGAARNTRLSVFDFSDTYFSEELRRSDPINQERECRLTSILHQKRWFLILLNCAKLKFVSNTTNWLEQTYDLRKCTMFHLK